MLYNLYFFSSKCLLFHNATLFGFCITHILSTGCAKIWKKKSVAKSLIFVILDSKLGDKNFAPNDSRHSPSYICCYIFQEYNFFCCGVYKILQLLHKFILVYLLILMRFVCVFCSRDLVVHLVLWTFPSRPTSARPANKSSVLLLIVYMLSPKMLTSSA